MAQPAPDAVALQKVLDRITASAMRYEGHLPDFTCTELTVRKEDSFANGTNWRTVDTFEELVSFASNGLVSKKLVKRNGRPTTKSRPGGLTENAVLAGAIVPRGIFGEYPQPKFAWDHWETRSDHRIAVIAYKAVGFNDPDGKTRYELKVSGRIFYDDTAGDLIRTESSNTGPPGYPLGEVRVEIDYAPVTLSDRELILPTSSVMMTRRGKRRYRSEFQFLPTASTTRILRFASRGVEADWDPGGRPLSEGVSGWTGARNELQASLIEPRENRSAGPRYRFPYGKRRTRRQAKRGR